MLPSVEKLKINVMIRHISFIDIIEQLTIIVVTLELFDENEYSKSCY